MSCEGIQFSQDQLSTYYAGPSAGLRLQQYIKPIAALEGSQEPGWSANDRSATWAATGKRTEHGANAERRSHTAPGASRDGRPRGTQPHIVPG